MSIKLIDEKNSVNDECHCLILGTGFDATDSGYGDFLIEDPAGDAVAASGDRLVIEALHCGKGIAATRIAGGVYQLDRTLAGSSGGSSGSGG